MEYKDLKLGSKWRHARGNKYELVCLANTAVDETAKFPHLVIYQSLSDGRMWSRGIESFRERFTHMIPQHRRH